MLLRPLQTKKKKRTTRVKVELDDGEADGSAAEAAKADPSASNGDVVMAEASGPSESLRRAQRMAETENFVDDDELQASLAKARRAKAKRTFAKMTPEMIAKNCEFLLLHFSYNRLMRSVSFNAYISFFFYSGTTKSSRRGRARC